jgi:toxin ParE1/3/4
MLPERFEVELTADAENDIEAIHAYLAEKRSAKDADRLLDECLGAVEALECFPLPGAIPKELDALGIGEFRQILLQPYRLIYRVVSAKVFILVIADGRRDMQALLERRLLGRST